MKPFKIKRDSWHYKLNHRFLNSYEYNMGRWEEDHADFCSYWRATFFRMIGATLGVLIVGVPVTAFLYLLFTAPMATLGAVAFVTAIFAFATAVFVGVSALQKWKRGRAHREPGLIGTKYMSWKGRYCPQAEYADE